MFQDQPDEDETVVEAVEADPGLEELEIKKRLRFDQILFESNRNDSMTLKLKLSLPRKIRHSCNFNFLSEFEHVWLS